MIIGVCLLVNKNMAKVTTVLGEFEPNLGRTIPFPSSENH